jgi:hypothetical protein
VSTSEHAPPRVIYARRRADENPVRTIRVLRKPATIE